MVVVLVVFSSLGVLVVAKGKIEHESRQCAPGNELFRLERKFGSLQELFCAAEALLRTTTTSKKAGGGSKSTGKRKRKK